jgi:hypothetical protein
MPKSEQENEEETTSSASSGGVLDTLSIVTDNLETYQGRDTLITLMHYLALIAADLCSYYHWGKSMLHSLLISFIFISSQ